MPKFIVYAEERSEGPLCNMNHTLVVDSEEDTSIRALNRRLYSGYSCSNLSYSGCEHCSNSRLTQVEVEPFSWRRAIELELTDEVDGPIRVKRENLMRMS
jgi:hypothetical protein